MSKRDGDCEIYVQPLEGPAKNVSNDPAIDNLPTFTADVRLGFVSSRDGGFDIPPDEAARLTAREGTSSTVITLGRRCQPTASGRSHGLLVCLALVAAGCGTDKPADTKGTSSKGSGGKKLQIAVIPKGTTHVFWKSVHAGAEKAVKELGDFEILWKGPLLEDDRDGQISVVVQDFVTKKVDGICVAPLDRSRCI